MAHGTRGRLLRLATTGFGVMLCTGLVGCLNSDKPKDTKTAAKQPQPGPGLPGMPQLPNGAGAVSKTGQPNSPYNGPGSNIQPAAYTGAPVGAAPGQTRFGTDGRNTNTTGVPPQPNFGNYPNQPGAGAIISPPTPPGGLQPVGGVGMSNPYPPPGGASLAGYTPPQLEPALLPPVPPYGPTGAPDFGNGGAVVLPPNPLGPVSPPLTPPVSPVPTGKGQPLSSMIHPG